MCIYHCLVYYTINRTNVPDYFLKSEKKIAFQLNLVFSTVTK
ncbi:hypothetical protein BSM4216_3845 [Bacillus smithii]|nr:hypothetical protein BSM4216_3845 [Bacillus smithii]